MISIKLEIVSNGIIKTSIDDNYNGAGSEWNAKTVYETDSDDAEIRLKNIQRFLYDLCDDLGVDLGNRYDPKVLNFEIGWGNKYEANLDEINKLISYHKNELKDLREWQKELQTKANDGTTV